MIIGISGKMGSGKDTVGKIIQYLTSKQLNNLNTKDSLKEFNIFLNSRYKPEINHWQIVKFADALKDIVCILTGCTREQLENIDFKNSKLGKNWEWGEGCNSNTTYRTLLQTLGTDLLRNQLHENVWVNALMSKYIPEYKFNDGTEASVKNWHNAKLPNWIITDVRFPNELEAIKDRGGIIIKVERNTILHYKYTDNDVKEKLSLMGYKDLSLFEELAINEGFEYSDSLGLWKHDEDVVKEHISERALDNAKFNYTVDNNGTIEELIEKVKDILIKARIL